MKFTEHVKLREEKFGTVIFETLKEKIFITNSTGKDIMNLLQQGYSLDEILHSLNKKYNEEDGCIKSEVLSFIEQLKTNQIIS